VKIISCSVLARRNVKVKKLYRKSKHILCSVTFFFESRAVYEIMWKNIVQRDRQATDGNTAHAHCVLDN